MKNLFSTILVLISFLTLSACGKSEEEDNKPNQTAIGDHTFTFTVNGNGFNKETFTATIPNDEAFAIYTSTPVGENKGVMFSASNYDKSIIANFIRKDNTLLPLGMDNGDESNFNHTIISFTFSHNGQSYTLQSVSGTCAEKSFQLHSSGSMAAIQATFNGTFSGGVAGTNNPMNYEVSGEVDAKFNGE